MCQSCVGGKQPSEFMIMADRMMDKYSYSSTGRGRSSSSKPKLAAKEEAKEEPKEQAPLVLPGTFQSWLLGVLQGGSSSWVSQYIESEFFELARQHIKTRTGGFDVQTVILACAALNAARVQVPAILNTALNQVKSQVTSSVVISGYDSQLYKGLLSFAREKSQERQSSGLQILGGQHKMRSLSGDLTPLSGNTQGSFWHNATHFTIEMDSSTAEKSKSDDFFPGIPDPSRNLTIRCFGRSQAPILALFEHIQKRISQSKKLEVIEMQAGASDKHSTRNKRPLSTVDLPPAMMQDITEDVELFFHKDSQAWYEQSGRPYRMGILAHGPPGTGKSSLVAGIASHINVPLVLINLQGMSDNDLREAFSRVPFCSVVALEDIDCVGADIGNRGAAQDAKPTPGASSDSSGSAIPSDNSQAIAIESMMSQFMDKQAAANQKVLSELKAIKAEVFGEDDYDEPRHWSQKPSTDKNDSSSTNSVTLSGLLNVIDGVNASEGRLVIMTTNHPEKLDPALYRAGRIERKFEITYASKASSIMTFKRLFDNDVCKRYTSDAINRFAFAFQAQFPSKSRITTAELAKYCGQYRGRPDIACKEFADWLKVGADKFTCPVDYTKVVDEAGVYNVPEPFDPTLLQVSPSDLVNPNAAAASGIEVVAPEPQPKVSRFWNPINALLNSGEYADLESIEDSLCVSDSQSDVHTELPQPSTASPHALILERCIGLGLVASQPNTSSVHSDDSTPEFEDEDLYDMPDFSLEGLVPAVVASPASSEESLWDDAHHNQTSPVRSAASVKFSEPGKLALASPRPIADECDFSDEERHDSVADDSDTAEE